MILMLLLLLSWPDTLTAGSIELMESEPSPIVLSGEGLTLEYPEDLETKVTTLLWTVDNHDLTTCTLV